MLGISYHRHMIGNADETPVERTEGKGVGVRVAAPLTLDEAPPVMRVDLAAQVALVNPKTIRQAIHRGELRALVSGRVIRIHREALRAWIMGEVA